MKKIIVVDPGSWSLTYDYFYIKEVAKKYYVEFHCSYSQYNGDIINEIAALENVTVVVRHLSGRKLFGVISYFAMWRSLLKSMSSVSAIHFVWSWVPVLDTVFFYFIRKKLVITFHNHRPHKKRSRKYRPFWFQYRLARSAVFISDFTRERFIEDWPKLGETHLLPIGASSMNLEFDREYCPRHVFRATLLFWGNVKEYKGLGLLLDQYAVIKENGWSLEIYGKFDDECKDQLERANSLSIPVVARFLSAEEVINLLTSGGVMIFPYLGITQSGAMYTALYYCLPFVCSRQGDMYRFLQENGLEELGFDSSDPQSLISALRFVKNNYDSVSQRLKTIRDVRNWEVPERKLREIYG